MEARKKQGFLPECAAAFVMTVLIMSVIMAVRGFAPFGEKSIMTSDLMGQYYDLTVLTAEKIKTGDNIFVSHEIGFGENLYAWVSYILIDPLNILFLIFEKTHYDALFLLVYIFKLGLAALFASVFFKKSRLVGINGFLNIAFSCLYAFGIFNVVECSINNMWLGNVAFLPVCCLGVESIFEKRRMELFAAAYFVCVMTNYYLAYITGIVSFIYLLYFAAAEEKNAKSTGAAMLRLVMSAAVSLGLSAIVLLPTASAIVDNYYKMFEVAEKAEPFAFSVGEVSRAMLLLVDDKLSMLKVLDVFFGLLPLMLTVALVFSDRIKRRERVAVICIAVFFVIAMLIRPLYVLMHFMRYPSGFEGRYAYGMAWMYIVFSMRVAALEEKLSKKQAAVPLILVIIGINFALSHESTVWYLVNSAVVLLFSVLYTVVFVLDKKTRLKAFSAFALIEAVLTAMGGVYMEQRQYVYYPKENHITYEETLADIVNDIKQSDEGFFRAEDVMEGSFVRLVQGSAGYNSMSVFSSLTNQKASAVSGNLGVCVISGNKRRDTIYNSIVTDSIFDVKYVFSTNKHAARLDANGKAVYPSAGRLTSDVYRKTAETDNTETYENTCAFPLMFKANEAVMGCDESFLDEFENFGAPFINQGIFLSSLTGRDADFYSGKEFEGRDLQNCSFEKSKDGTEVLMLDNLADGVEFAQSEDELGIVMYSFDVDEPGEYFADFWFITDISDIKGTNFMIMVNDVELLYDGVSQTFLYDIGQLDKGDKITVKIVSGRNGVKMVEPMLVRLNKDAFVKIAEGVQKNGLSDIKKVKGDIAAEADFDEDSFIFTTIGYNDGFHIYIDGIETEKIKVMDAFLGYKVPGGKHQVYIKYVSPGVKEGACISLLTLAACVVLCVVGKSKRKDGSI